MPYVPQRVRRELNKPLLEIIERLKSIPAWDCAGVLNYVITKIIVSLWFNTRAYHMGNSIIGALNCAAAEFTRRHLNEYEDGKIIENGDVLPMVLCSICETVIEGDIRYRAKSLLPYCPACAVNYDRVACQIEEK